MKYAANVGNAAVWDGLIDIRIGRVYKNNKRKVNEQILNGPKLGSMSNAESDYD